MYTPVTPREAYIPGDTLVGSIYTRDTLVGRQVHPVHTQGGIYTVVHTRYTQGGIYTVVHTRVYHQRGYIHLLHPGIPQGGIYHP